MNIAEQYGVAASCFLLVGASWRNTTAMNLKNTESDSAMKLLAIGYGQNLLFPI